MTPVQRAPSGRRPDMAVFLKRAKESLNRQDRPHLFGFTDTYYANKFEKVWTENRDGTAFGNMGSGPPLWRTE